MKARRTTSKSRAARSGRPARRAATALAPHKIRTSPGTDYYLIDELLTPADRAVRDRVREFSDSQVIPIINEFWEDAEFPFEIVPKLAKLGVAGGTTKGFGCPGLTPMATGLVGMELSRGDGSVSTFYGVHSSLAMGSIAMLGSTEHVVAISSSSGLTSSCPSMSTCS